MQALIAPAILLARAQLAGCTTLESCWCLLYLHCRCWLVFADPLSVLTHPCRRPPFCFNQGPCGHCGAEESSQWRAGPPEHPVLCDPCGRHFRKTKTLPKRKRRSLTQHFAGGTDTPAAAAERLVSAMVVLLLLVSTGMLVLHYSMYGTVTASVSHSAHSGDIHGSAPPTGPRTVILCCQHSDMTCTACGSRCNVITHGTGTYQQCQFT